MKFRKSTSLFLLLCLLVSLAVPAAATAPEPIEPPVLDPIEAPEAPSDSILDPEQLDGLLSDEVKPETPPREDQTYGFEVKQFAPPDEIFTTLPKAAMLVELNSDTVLYALDPDERNFPASLTKIMTCMLALEYGNLDDVITVSENAVTGLDEAASVSGLKAGEEMRLEDLLYCVMLESANEACNVVAEYISGDNATFVDLMNETAAKLGCTGTHFMNPHGLHDEEHYTTARDMATIAKAALENPMFRKICGTANYTLPATNLQESREIATANKLMLNTVGSGFYYSKASGVKTGFTTPAQCCLISTADNGNIQLLAVILGAPLIQNEHEDWIHRNFPECINLFEYGFNHFKIATVTSTLYPVAEVNVSQSAGAQTVAMAPTSDVRTLIDSDFDPHEILLDIDLPAATVEAPIETGDLLGHVTVTYHNMILGESDLAAITSIARSELSHKADGAKAFVSHNWWKWLVGILIFAVVLLVGYMVFLHVERRLQRKRRIAARRRALEQQRRRKEFRDNYPDV